jgi:broad specificity phosphatase PhoE
MRVILIRHGEASQMGREVIGTGDRTAGLTEHGVQQVGRLADRLQATGELSGCTTLLHSPTLRTRQTADIVAAALPNARREENTSLVEMRPGAAAGMTWTAYRAQYGGFDPVAEPLRPFAPGGESWVTFLTRVHATLDGLAAGYPAQTVVAVTHAGFIVAAFLSIFDIPRPGTRGWIDPICTGLTEWERDGENWRLIRYNDTCHLGGLSLAR